MPYRDEVAACRNCRQELLPVTDRGGRFLRCVSCGSAFIREEALRTIWQTLEPTRELTITERTEGARAIDCPVCDERLRPAVASLGVEVDRCAAHGIWLDAGEMGPTLAAAYLDETTWWRQFGHLVKNR